MRFRTRAFLFCFIPFAVLFGVSFWIAQKSVQSTVRSELLASLRESQLSLARAQANADLQKSRFLKIEGESAELKSGMQLLLSDSPTGEARTAMEGELRSLGEEMDYDLMFVSAPDGGPLAGVVREAGAKQGQKSELIPMENGLVTQPARGLLVLGDRMFHFASAPIDKDAANLGTLSVGEYFNLPQASEPAVLVHERDVVDFNLPNVLHTHVQAAMNGCAGKAECDFRLGGANWIAIPLQELGGGYRLWSLENVDAATNPMRARLRSLFLVMEFGSLLVALLCSILSSHSIEKPIALLISRLHSAERTGVLSEASLARSSTREMRELTESFTRAAVSARISRHRLKSAYVEFVGSLANALDARDRYTSGHSGRVSRYSSATALAMGLDRDLVEQVRIGAQLHDIGKIGIPDTVLQKHERLTAEEFALVQEHPAIGRRILEGVAGLAAYLNAVELHHENWDGSGYPRGQRGEETPIDARIIHIADAYDAMTSHRPYRRAMTHNEAIEELVRYAGTQFDPTIVEVFARLPIEDLSGLSVVPIDRGRVQEFEAKAARRAY